MSQTAGPGVLRVVLLTALTMLAFASNSLLNRAAMLDGQTGPATFSLIRVASGAAFLVFVATMRGDELRLFTRRRAATASALILYLIGFSYAYLWLDAGLGALILFAGVQITMFSGVLVAGVRPGPFRWLGMVIGLLGLVLLLWPGDTPRVTPIGAGLMLAAALGWGIYSLLGRGAWSPLADTAGSFLLATPLMAGIWLVSGEGLGASTSGVLLALASGVVTSGMGYALWYTVLPHLESTQAGLAQLTVPVIAVAAGFLLLGESVDLATLGASAIVLLGVALGVLGPSGQSAPRDRR